MLSQSIPPDLVTSKVCDSASWPLLVLAVLKALTLNFLPGWATKLVSLYSPSSVSTSELISYSFSGKPDASIRTSLNSSGSVSTLFHLMMLVLERSHSAPSAGSVSWRAETEAAAEKRARAVKAFILMVVGRLGKQRLFGKDWLVDGIEEKGDE